MRLVPATTLAMLALGLAACGTLGYEDTNAAVDERTECVGASNHPGDPVAPWCKREQSATWSSESKRKPVDFSGKDD
jgi:hypothetical protein